MNQSKKIGWQPLPGSQTAVLACPADEILYHGTRGPGKTAAQLSYFTGRCGRGYGTHWRGIIFDRSYKNLDDIVKKSRELIPQIFPQAKFLSSKSDYCWKFPDGETLLFRHLDRITDYDKYHGHEYPFIGWNELTKFPTSELYDTMLSCNRSAFLPHEHSPKLTEVDKKVIDDCVLLDEPIPEDIGKKILPDIPLVCFSTTNPYGAGHTWVKKRWIDRAPPGALIKHSTTIFNPRTKKEEMITNSLVHIFGSYKENRFLDPKYIAKLDAIKDVNKRKAWLGGDWSVTSGGALDDLWSGSTHIIPRFIIPDNWKITRAFDWGSSHPFAVGFWAISNGEEIQLMTGQRFSFPRGSLIRFGEIYGAETVTCPHTGRQVPNYGSNKGVKASAREVARRIVEYEEELLEDGWISSKPEDGPADGQIFNVNESESGSIASKMAAEGVTWYAADKSKGTRKNGLELFRIALENSLLGEGPGLYIMSHCESFIETVPNIPRGEEKNIDDVDTTAEDHIYDETRYMILDEKPSFADGSKLNVGFAN
ncbi:hypothetical protein OAB00_01410 [Akkermansiaceae bacterium]|nr:hypothetical protein [Akkermansiaceae bacterium]